MGYVEQWPAVLVIKVDNAAATSFQQATKANAKLQGACNLLGKRVQGRRGDSDVVTEKARTTLNLSDVHVHVLTKCRLTATSAVRTKPLTQLGRLVHGLRDNNVRHSGGALGAGALPGADKYRTTAGG